MVNMVYMVNEDKRVHRNDILSYIIQRFMGKKSEIISSGTNSI